MTRDEIMALDIEALETRAAEIEVEIREADAEKMALIDAEIAAIEERKAAINAEIETRKKDVDAVIAGKGDTIEKIVKERKPTEMEIRNSKDYLDAWVEMQKGRATVEQRALLTENATNGTIAVPVYVEEKVNTAWESNEIVRRVKRSYFKGNLRVPVEVSASGATVHVEGAAAISEENLVINFVELIPQTVKKMVKYSTEVLDLKGSAWVDYIFDEIEYQIVKMCADLIVTTAVASTYTAEQRIAGTAITTADIVNAQGLLGGEATNPVLITTRATAAALKAAAISGNYGYDPFDGLDVLYTSSAALNGALAIVADLSGIQINFPDGDQPTFVVDEYTEAAADIVRVIGRMMAAIGVIATGKIVKITPSQA